MSASIVLMKEASLLSHHELEIENSMQRILELQ
jgi:hypothetical protein